MFPLFVFRCFGVLAKPSNPFRTPQNMNNILKVQGAKGARFQGLRRAQVESALGLDRHDLSSSTGFVEKAQPSRERKGS